MIELLVSDFENLKRIEGMKKVVLTYGHSNMKVQLLNDIDIALNPSLEKPKGSSDEGTDDTHRDINEGKILFTFLNSLVSNHPDDRVAYLARLFLVFINDDNLESAFRDVTLEELMVVVDEFVVEG